VDSHGAEEAAWIRLLNRTNERRDHRLSPACLVIRQSYDEVLQRGMSQNENKGHQIVLRSNEMFKYIGVGTSVEDNPRHVTVFTEPLSLIF
jgi:hypothetical protein